MLLVSHPRSTAKSKVLKIHLYGFFSRNCMALALALGPLIYFELLFVLILEAGVQLYSVCEDEK